MIEDIRYAVVRKWSRISGGTRRRAGGPMRTVLEDTKTLQVKINGEWQNIRQEVILDESKTKDKWEAFPPRKR